jgi:hypothetical protein
MMHGQQNIKNRPFTATILSDFLHDCTISLVFFAVWYIAIYNYRIVRVTSGTVPQSLAVLTDVLFVSVMEVK